jgi:hypothetical protein
MKIADLLNAKNQSMVYHDNKNDLLIIAASPASGVLYVTANSPHFISGQIRLRGKSLGRYPYNYLEMIDNIFGKARNTIEVCSGSINSESCFTVDINPDTRPSLVDDGQELYKIAGAQFDRWRCDPPYNLTTAEKMYGTGLPSTRRLLNAGARVCKIGSLMFLLLGPKNYQMCPPGVRRIGWIALSIIPNNELRALHIFYKYADSNNRIYAKSK